MYIKVNLHIVLKEKPRDYRGLCQARYQVDSPGALSEALCGTIFAVCEAAFDMGLLHDQEDLEEQLSSVKQFMDNLAVLQ